MATHHLDPAPDTVTDVFSRELPPVLTVDPGDRVVVTSLDASGYTTRQTQPGEHMPTLIANRHGHCLTGPIAVRGAQPGMMLGVSLESLNPVDWGWTVAGVHDNWLNKRLGVAGADPTWLLWDIDWDAGKKSGTATETHGHSVDLAPFLGVVGLPPDEPGTHSTIPPRPCGGNIDCRELVAGSTLYLPVTVPDALLSMGDGHGAQGDGEVSGTAVECGMTTTCTLDLVTEPPIRTIHATTPWARITFGFSEDLNDAMAQALDAMAEWMTVIYDVDKPTALALASPSVDLRITQVVNLTWGVHAVLRNGALR